LADLTEIDGTSGFWTLGDFRPEMPLVSGRTALIHRLCVRLQTPRGRFSFWPNFGTDMAAFLLTKVRPTDIASAAESECLKDQQVEDVKATVELRDNGRSMLLTLEIFDSEGPFTFTLSIDQAKLELIELQAA
jgi:hypothetical protein